MSKKNDPLDELFKAHKTAKGIEDTSSENTISSEDEEDIYGLNDRQLELEEEEREEEEARERAYAEARAKREEENPKVQMAPENKNMDECKKEIDFQTHTLEIVSNMVNEVAKKYNITEGEVPEDRKMAVMGELKDLYYEHGETVTEEFENYLLSNIILPDGTNYLTHLNQQKTATETVTETKPVVEETHEEETVVVKDKNNEDIVIKIDSVNSSNPVNVNIDKDLLDVTNVEKSQKINVNVREITDVDLNAYTVIENSSRDDIITKYDSGINDVPITLPMSAYRCVMKPLTYIDFVKLNSVTSQNISELEIKNWTIIYDHMKNISIGEFKDFNEFLKLTKYQDRELLMWGVLVATADDTEEYPFACENPKCDNAEYIKYSPRSIIHIDDKLVPEYYNKIHEVSVGDNARKLCNDVAFKCRRFVLPDSKIIVEVADPSAYDFINTIYPALSELYKEYRPDGTLGEDLTEAEQNAIAEWYLMEGIMLYTKAMIIRKGDKEYRYTNAADYKKIMSVAMSTRDSGIILALMNKFREECTTPVSFAIPEYICPKCGQKHTNISIVNIANQLFTQVSRRLQNIAITLTELQEN